MKVDKEISDSWTELAFQDLLIDVAAAVAATAPGRARNGDDPERTESGVCRKSAPAWQASSTGGII
jgi:hypothetical protein